MDLQLKGKLAFISGSTAGIGFACAKRLLQEGAAVIINGRTKSRVDEAISALQKAVPSADIRGLAADFSKPSEINALFDTYPSVDILINNVGIFEPRSFAEITDEEWRLIYEVNVLSGIRLSRFYFPKMMEKDWGRIIFISSESAIHIPEEMIHYGMTKTAQLAISRGLAELTKGKKVTVNSVLPGPTRSEGVGNFLLDLAKKQQVSGSEVEASFFKTARPTSIIQRFLVPDEIANLVVYI